jgi:DNA-directed RNA polymerase subunit RPC12/RpoP
MSVQSMSKWCFQCGKHTVHVCIRHDPGKLEHNTQVRCRLCGSNSTITINPEPPNGRTAAPELELK